MTLKEYEAEFKNEHKVHANGSIFIELETNQTSKERIVLWRLDDYHVSSASALVVWLVPKQNTLANKYKQEAKELKINGPNRMKEYVDGRLQGKSIAFAMAQASAVNN